MSKAQLFLNLQVNEFILSCLTYFIMKAFKKNAYQLRDR
ncbi:MAG: hypothetical protein BAJALOKI1v1_890009 [Promethearchaeota archaeon]|nr:MAG: hypothetical protein BAJALOKI1v1_890009 [Candidatus Lokiarchaeota archaeon]